MQATSPGAFCVTGCQQSRSRECAVIPAWRLCCLLSLFSAPFCSHLLQPLAAGCCMPDQERHACHSCPCSCRAASSVQGVFTDSAAPLVSILCVGNAHACCGERSIQHQQRRRLVHGVLQHSRVCQHCSDVACCCAVCKTGAQGCLKSQSLCTASDSQRAAPVCCMPKHPKLGGAAVLYAVCNSVLAVKVLHLPCGGGVGTGSEALLQSVCSVA